MRISLNWLKEFIDLDHTPEALADLLTMAGFEVEDIEDRRTWADGVVVGRVLQREPHPDADKLSVCQVDIGQAHPSTIVCGAANVRADILVPVATLGTYLPVVDLKIKPRKLRGTPSEGMICSLAELGLAKESEGIHIFTTAELTVGEDARPSLGLDDVIFDVTSTANRADALSLVGLARELAAITGQPLRLPAPAPIAVPAQTALNLRIQEPQACPVYIGTVIEKVTIGPSPAWLQRRLQASGTRPINNVVDITNYVLLEWGQPLHAFDRDRLQALKPDANLQLGVRLAQSDETLTTLDGQARSLSPQTLLITAFDQPVALAGVMGGAATEVFEGTQNVVLEAAYFDPAAIRRSARNQGLRTEASARYERGVNLAELTTAAQRAIQMMVDLAGGTVTAQVTEAAPGQPKLTQTIELRHDRVNAVLGLVEDDTVDEGVRSLQASDIEPILTALGCTVTPTEQEGVWQVQIPPYRYRDLEREIDLIEEIARLYGYDRFCETLPAKTEPGYLPAEVGVVNRLRAAFRAAGLTEVVHYSLGKPLDDHQVRLANPLFTEYSALRADLTTALIEAFQYNLEQGNGALNAYEIGRVFWSDEEGLGENDAIAGVIGGDPTQGRWPRSGRETPLSWFEAKGLLEGVFTTLGLTVEYQPDRRDERLHPGRTASLWLHGERLGTFGQLHPKLRQAKGLPEAVYVFDLDLDILLNALVTDEALVPRFAAYATYPASDRDIAFFAPTQVAVADLERAIVSAGKSLLESVELFDEYQGQNVPAGQRSLAFRLVYRASDRTLTDQDVDPVHQAVRETLVEKFHVSLRS